MCSRISSSFNLVPIMNKDSPAAIQTFLNLFCDVVRDKRALPQDNTVVMEGSNPEGGKGKNLSGSHSIPEDAQ